MVPNMFKSILSGGVSGNKAPKKFDNVCLAEEDQRCENTFAFVEHDTIYWCPLFFTDHATVRYDLSAKEFDAKGWCTPPPHIIGHLFSTDHTALHEMTHLSLIISHALALSIGEPETEIMVA
ncbi:hypothetical protein BT96DRAFT_48310 [Gymnopus androsaceus JB14]|uniref:Uncharacterized protein n=1 Tax=Gymnopus androsaceus JB14 TaxID=1447944 RepID=A0A6A4HM32_9AGAR|nr:hypothetical protein BT96DRAFT_48310 [Gymnopus androsaceus JB14]